MFDEAEEIERVRVFYRSGNTSEREKILDRINLWFVGKGFDIDIVEVIRPELKNFISAIKKSYFTFIFVARDVDIKVYVLLTFLPAEYLISISIHTVTLNISRDVLECKGCCDEIKKGLDKVITDLADFINSTFPISTKKPKIKDLFVFFPSE